jgi:CO/xanthine dehydrogenase Mo-binding subunit
MISRRSFLRWAATSGGGLMLATMPGCSSPQQVHMQEVVKKKGAFSPNIFLTIRPDGRVLLALNKSEIGQGVMTGAAVLVAEELEVPVSAVRPFHHSDPAFETSIGEADTDTGGLVGMQITGGSSSTPENYLPLRRAGAAAREMLISAAAKKWGAERSDCKAKSGAVVHRDGRKLSYGELTRDAAQGEIVESPPLKDPKDFTLIGRPTIRVDARAKVDGTAKYGTDISLPNMLRAYVIHPPTLGADVKELDASRAKKMPGIADVFAFERGVAVLADKYWQARAAAQKVKVTWSGGILSGLDTADLEKASRRRLREAPTHTLRDDGDVDDALSAGGRKMLDVTYDVPYLAHAPMEPMNCTVWVQGDKAKVWAPNQSPTIMAEGISRALGIGREDVAVKTTMSGGGFGRRSIPDFVVEAALIAKRVSRPVQLAWTREQDTRAGYYRPAVVARMRGAVDASGEVHAVSYHGASQPISADISHFLGALYPEWLPLLAKRLMLRANTNFISSGSFPDYLATEGMSDTPYEVENVRVGYTPVRTGLPVAFWRSVGHSFNGFINESFMDELAHAAGKDPFAFRLALLGKAHRHRGVLEAAAKLGRWGKPIDEGWGRGIAVHESFGSFVSQVVEAGVVNGRIRVRRVACAVDCGVAVNPDVVKAQMEGAIVFGLSAALDQRIDLVNGVVQQGNFDTYRALRMHETPEIAVKIVPSGEDPTGVGEPGLPPVAPALAGALFQATGVRLRSLPLQDAWNAHQRRQK